MFLNTASSSYHRNLKSITSGAGQNISVHITCSCSCIQYKIDECMLQEIKWWTGGVPNKKNLDHCSTFEIHLIYVIDKTAKPTPIQFQKNNKSVTSSSFKPICWYTHFYINVYVDIHASRHVDMHTSRNIDIHASRVVDIHVSRNVHIQVGLPRNIDIHARNVDTRF